MGKILDIALMVVAVVLGIYLCKKVLNVI